MRTFLSKLTQFQRIVGTIVLAGCLLSLGISLYFVYKAQRMSVQTGQGRIVNTLPRLQRPATALKPLPSGTTQNHKLGVFLLSSYSFGAKEVISAYPRVIKVMDPHVSVSLSDAVKEYSSITPDGIVIVRISGKIDKFTVTDNPKSSAEQYMKEVVAPALSAMKPIHNDIDIIEAPNEVEQTPGWNTIEEVRWNGQFWARLTELIHAEGFRTCVGSFPVGNPGGTTEEITAKMQAFSPALEAALKTESVICYHGYSIQYTTDPGIEHWYALRHRVLHEAMVVVKPEYADIPFVISEAGIDSAGDPATSGWKARGTEEQYIEWLEWYDKELQYDSYVLGATLFQIGDSYWSSFSHEDIAWWLKRYLGDTDR